MSKPSLGAGNVEISLAGETVLLRPTLRAAQAISRQGGGIMGAIERVAKCDADTITSVIALGLDKPVKDVAEQVWRTGYYDLAASVIEYLSTLGNGGRPPENTGGEEAPDPPASG